MFKFGGRMTKAKILILKIYFTEERMTKGRITEGITVISSVRSENKNLTRGIWMDNNTNFLNNLI